jgi:phosphoribosylaminoimidazolecarboxamide formyltransferase/IMP cyclohydrolase
MEDQKKIKKALISVYYKEGLAQIVQELHRHNVEIFSTGGTQDAIEALGIPVTAVDALTAYPSILGGRVKTLHPKVFGGILGRRGNSSDSAEMARFEIPEIDLVIVDLYPFEETVAAGGSDDEIIEKIDIGGISLIRAAAKNHRDVLIVASRSQYAAVLSCLQNGQCSSTLAERKRFATAAFAISSHYDTKIYAYFAEGDDQILKTSFLEGDVLRYGENPHQKGVFFGNFNAMFDQLSGKALSYNNLLDVDAAIALMAEFQNDAPTFAILKHNNACGCASRPTLSAAYAAAHAADPTSAFGGILIANRTIDKATADLIHDLFCEVVIAPDFDLAALALLNEKKNRILLRQKSFALPQQIVRTALNGFLVQDRDIQQEVKSDLKLVTQTAATDQQITDLLFANKLVKHTKSNTIVFVKDGQLLASGTGQTSRVDALRQAADKAKFFGFDLRGAVMASDAFFPFPDCVELAHNDGVTAVIQPGGSVKDEQSIAYCDANGMAMYFTGNRHFKH